MRIYENPKKKKRINKREKKKAEQIKKNVLEPTYHVSKSGEKIKYIRDNN